MKTCKICNEEKTLEEFTKSKKSLDGRGSYCKLCHRQYTKTWNERNPERVRQNRRVYNTDNSDKIKAARKVYKSENKDYFLDYARRYAKEKPHKALLYEARKRAKDFGLDFAITDKDIVVPEFCPILGVRIEPGRLVPASLGEYADTDTTRSCTKRRCDAGPVWLICPS